MRNSPASLPTEIRWLCKGCIDVYRLLTLIGAAIRCRGIVGKGSVFFGELKATPDNLNVRLFDMEKEWVSRH